MKIEQLEKCSDCGLNFVIQEFTVGDKKTRIRSCKCGVKEILPGGQKVVPLPKQKEEAPKKPPPRVEGYRVQPILMVLRCFNPDCDGEMQFTGDKLTQGGNQTFKHICNKCGAPEFVVDAEFPNIKYRRQ